MTFKVGDRVRCYENPSYNRTLKGAVGTVVEVPDNCARTQDGKPCLHVVFTENTENMTLSVGPVPIGYVFHFNMGMYAPTPPEACLEIISPITPEEIEEAIQSLRETYRTVT